MVSDLFNLKNKVCVLFGGNGILGTEFNKTLVAHNATVVSVDLSIPETKIEGIDYRVIDARKPDQLEQFVNDLVDKYKHIDVLINSTTSKGNDFYLPFEEVSLEGWNIGLEGNLTVPFLTAQKFVGQMVKQKSGSIINIGSVYGVVGNDQRIYEGSNLHEIYVENHPDIKQIYSHGVYNASKGGLVVFTKYLAAYYGKDNIRVNCISPGGIEYPKENDTFLKKYGEKTPLGRKAKRNEVNGAIVYLASDASTYVTGHNLVVDGGFSIW